MPDDLDVAIMPEICFTTRLLVTRHRASRPLLLVTIFLLCCSATAQSNGEANSKCGPLYIEGQYGPYDFRTDKQMLPIVLREHFTPEVESLVRGRRTRTPGGDIDYTLRTIPNHPNALTSMMLLGERNKTDKPEGSRYTIECWFDRAIRFRPDDQIVRMIFVTYLTKNNRKPDALEQLSILLSNAKDNPFTHHNIGLLYFDLGEYAIALKQAHKALSLGLSQRTLIDKLMAIGQWRESTESDQTVPLEK